MTDPIDDWLAVCPDPATDPVRGMAEAGLLEPCADYATIARIKAALVERTGLLGVASVWGGRQLVFRHFLEFGTDAQRAEWSGRALAVAISEPKVGAHPKLLTTRADAFDGGYRLTGEKAWVSNGPSAEAIIVFAITGEAGGRKRYSAFIVPRDTVGLRVSEMPGFHALRPSRHCLVRLDGCAVPASSMLGEAGTAYERMAHPFRDVEDAVGTYGVLGAVRCAVGLFRGSGLERAEALGAVVALNAVFAAGAEAVVEALDGGASAAATLVGLRVLALEIVLRLRALGLGAAGAILGDLDAVLGIARGPRLARQVALGEAALR
jgi:acyl-CoA dehydrogenase